MLNQQPLHPSDVGLILSYKCQSACAHCLYNCGPAWEEWITPEAVEEALQAMKIWQGPFQVHITGGEPFLKFPLLLHAVEVARQLAIPRYVETNAGWCVREELVRRRFRALKQAGLQSILISCSPFHAETIPPERTLLAIEVAAEIFGSHAVSVYLPAWLEHVRRFGAGKTTPLEKYAEIYGQRPAGRLFWEGYGLISGGRSGYRLGHLKECHSASSFRGHNCRRDILFAHHSHFDLYGNYISGFCGGLRVGNWHDLPTLMKQFQAGKYPQLIQILITSGPFGLYKLARDSYGYQQTKDGYAGKCHLCVDVRRHLVREESFPELQPARFYDLI
jgi:hypothetical protein